MSIAPPHPGQDMHSPLLEGKHILVTRAREQAGDLIRCIEEAGGTAVVCPTIQIREPASWEACDRAIAGLYMYDGLLFTSSNAVSSFLERCTLKGQSLQELGAKRIFAVGGKTRQTLGEANIPVTAVPERSTARDLANLIGEEDLHGRAFLFPCGNLAGTLLAEHLRALGADVDRAVVYSTVLPSEQDIARLEQTILEGTIDVATFLSPSSFQNFSAILSAERVRKLASFMHLAAIGPTTAQAIREAGLDPAIIAEHTTVESLVDAIGKFFALHHTT